MDELQILITSGDELAHSQIVDFETQTCPAASVRVFQTDQPVLPSMRQDCRFASNTVRISSCSRRMPESAFEFANFQGSEDSHEWTVLPQPLRFLALVLQ